MTVVISSTASVITVQLKSHVTAQIYQNKPMIAITIKGESSCDCKAVPWAYQPKRKGKMTEIVATHRMIRSSRYYVPEDQSSKNLGRKKNQRRMSLIQRHQNFGRRCQQKILHWRAVEENPDTNIYLDLLLSFDVHRDVLVKVLSGVSVPTNATSEVLTAIIW